MLILFQSRMYRLTFNSYWLKQNFLCYSLLLLSILGGHIIVTMLKSAVKRCFIHCYRISLLNTWMVNLLRVIECHVIQRKVICDRGLLLNYVAEPYCQVRLGRKVWAKITVLSDFTLVIENTIIKHLLVISFVLLRFNLRISAPFHQHHGLKDPHLLLKILKN